MRWINRLVSMKCGLKRGMGVMRTCENIKGAKKRPCKIKN
jgi:hypothetical protein